MKQTLSLCDFREAFKQTRPENFSYEGLKVLFKYLESIEESTGEEFELDVIGICCDFSEIPISEVAEDEEGLIIGRTENSVVVLNS